MPNFAYWAEVGDNWRAASARASELIIMMDQVSGGVV